MTRQFFEFRVTLLNNDTQKRLSHQDDANDAFPFLLLYQHESMDDAS